MLQVLNDTIREIPAMTTVATGGYVPTTTTGQLGNCTIDYWQPVYWNSYPVYVCTDKTKKAIEVLKALQAEKLLQCESVPRFIELVEKISGLL
jgi:hypothetical protein